ncbi:hypothetical protein UFOVP328_156 [uncultured Caudovirales phage]|uniref:Uncharacterized protein n=1 Tax=uncultured Caudovirales phage TaxID=2100421 RepID=A0A6J5LXU4_9CAUD|nr:hypothetical protein UFOVP328_156 [uncultured Caudovirales phage]
MLINNLIKFMRGSYSGNTLAFQANAESSILLPRSKQLGIGVVVAHRILIPLV